MTNRRQWEQGVKWVRPAEFADDLDVEDLYERLLAEGELTVTHEYRTPDAEIGKWDWSLVVGRPEDRRAVRNRVAAVTRRAAEDGLKTRAEQERRRQLSRDYWRRSQRISIDGPLTAELADAAAEYRRQAEATCASLREGGQTLVSYIYAEHALLATDPNALLKAEIERLAGEMGLALRWSPGGELGMHVKVVGRRDAVSGEWQ